MFERVESAIARGLWALALVAATGCGPPAPKTVAVSTDKSGTTVELNPGDTLSVQLPGEASILKKVWVEFDVADNNQLQRAPSTDPGTFNYLAVGGGETTLSYFFQVPEALPTYEWFRLTVRVSGAALSPAVERERIGMVPAGGFGPSRESGRSILDLALFPTDLTLGNKDRQLLVSSEGRLWSIDPTTRVGTIRLGGPGERAATALPATGNICSAYEQPDGTLLLALVEGDYLDSTMVSGELTPGGAWTEKLREHHQGQLNGCRIRPTPSMTVGYVVFDGSVLASADSQGRPVAYQLDGNTSTGRIVVADTLATLVRFSAAFSRRSTDYTCSVGAQAKPDYGRPGSYHPAITSAVAQAPDGSVWSYRSEIFEVDAPYVYDVRGRGLHRSEPPR